MVRIITDSAADISVKEAQELSLDIIPMKVNFGDEEYIDGITLSSQQFFEKLIESDTLPKTSQIPPFSFVEAFQKYPDDDIICITISKKLSGSYNNALVAAREFKNVYVVDSSNVTVGENILVRYALKLAKENLSVKQIVDKLENKKKSIRLIGLLDTLKYLYKGGRISKVTAVFGDMLRIKPVVEIKDGKVGLIGKARGSKQGHNYLRTLLNNTNGIDFTLPVALAYSGLSDILLNKYIDDSSDLYPDHRILIKTQIGSTIGTHIGPGAIALAFFEKENK